jgi:hypothetical protein
MLLGVLGLAGEGREREVKCRLRRGKRFTRASTAGLRFGKHGRRLLAGEPTGVQEAPFCY